MRVLRWPLAREVFALQLVVLALVITAAATLGVLHTRHDKDAATRELVTAVSVALAQAPSTVAAVRSADPTMMLQPVTERIRKQTGLDFLVVMAPNRIRFTHTDPTRIGQPFSGNIDQALAGVTFTESYAGSLGPSIRAVTPVYDNDRVVALVAAGVTRARIRDSVGAQLPLILAIAAAGLAVAAASAWLSTRRLHRQTHGMAPAQLRAMYDHHDAVLHSVHEGLLVFGTSPTEPAAVVNDEARRLLDLPATGPVYLDDLPESLRRKQDPDVQDEMHVTANRVLVVNSDSVERAGKQIGTVTTVRDHTELRAVLGELYSLRGLTATLQAQTHEAANRLHTVIALVELGRDADAVSFATTELELSQALVERLSATIGEPALAALLVGKVGQAAERGIELTVSTDTLCRDIAPLTAHEAVTLVGNLVDNAFDAAGQSEDGWVEVTVRAEETVLLVRVADSGTGLPTTIFDQASTRGYSTKTGHLGLGLALVSQLVRRRHGSIRTEQGPEAAVVVEIPR